MRIESSVTSITWIPSDAIAGMTKLPFELGVAHYDDPPPDRLEDLDGLRERDAFREANELRAYVEVEDGKVVDSGHLGRGLIGVTRIKLGPEGAQLPGREVSGAPERAARSATAGCASRRPPAGGWACPPPGACAASPSSRSRARPRGRPCSS